MGDGFEVLEVVIDMRERRIIANEKNESVNITPISLTFISD
jgi:hypothetical protein